MDAQSHAWSYSLKIIRGQNAKYHINFFCLNGQCESCDNDMKLDSLKIIRGQNAKYHIIFFFVLNGQCESCDND